MTPTIAQQRDDKVRQRVEQGAAYCRQLGAARDPREAFPGLTDCGYRALAAYDAACATNRALRRGRGLQYLLACIRG